jgi:hypothetical protein
MSSWSDRGRCQARHCEQCDAAQRFTHSRAEDPDDESSGCLLDTVIMM